MEQYKYYKYKYKYLNLKQKILLGGYNYDHKNIFELFENMNPLFSLSNLGISISREQFKENSNMYNTETSFITSILSLFTNKFDTEIINIIFTFTFSLSVDLDNEELKEEMIAELKVYIRNIDTDDNILKTKLILLVGLFYLVKYHDFNKRYIQILNLHYIFSKDSDMRHKMITTIFNAKDIVKLFIDKPKDFYQLDEKQKTKFKNEFNKLNGENTKMVTCFEKLIDSFELISFDNYIETVIKCLNNLPDNYVLLIQIDKIVKSNEWLPLLVYVLLCVDIDFTTLCEGRYNFLSDILTELKNTKKPKDVFLFYIFDDILLKKIGEHCTEKKYNVVYCDDASYSGSQLDTYINIILEKINNLHLFVPYISDDAKMVVSSKKCKIISECTINKFDDSKCFEIFKTIFSNKNTKLTDKMAVTLFEHKLADNVSTYTHLILGSLFYYIRYDSDYLNVRYLLNDENSNKTLIKNCNDPNPLAKILNEDEDSCMFAFYKRSLKDVDYFMSLNNSLNDVDDY